MNKYHTILKSIRYFINTLFLFVFWVISTTGIQNFHATQRYASGPLELVTPVLSQSYKCGNIFLRKGALPPMAPLAASLTSKIVSN